MAENLRKNGGASKVASVQQMGQTRISRARRFVIRAVLHYRVRGERRWREGRTENMSNSGVWFRAEEAVPAGTTIEMSIILPVENSGDGGAKIVCHGVVVRATESNDGFGAMMAVRITRSHLARG
jgi:hypothetical protein